jgi:hypothetical protein
MTMEEACQKVREALASGTKPEEVEKQFWRGALKGAEPTEGPSQAPGN